MRERDLDIYWPTSAYQTAQMAQSIVDALRTKRVRRRVNRCDAWLSGPDLIRIYMHSFFSAMRRGVGAIVNYSTTEDPAQKQKSPQGEEGGVSLMGWSSSDPRDALDGVHSLRLPVPFLTNPAEVERLALEARLLAEALANHPTGMALAPVVSVLAGCMAEYAEDLDAAYANEAAAWSETLPDYFETSGG